MPVAYLNLFALEQYLRNLEYFSDFGLFIRCTLFTIMNRWIHYRSGLLTSFRIVY